MSGHDPTARRLLGWTVPMCVEYEMLPSGQVEVRCGHGHAEGIPTIMAIAADANAYVGSFLREHAHGEEVGYAPLMEQGDAPLERSVTWLLDGIRSLCTEDLTRDRAAWELANDIAKLAGWNLAGDYADSASRCPEYHDVFYGVRCHRTERHGKRHKGWNGNGELMRW